MIAVPKIIPGPAGCVVRRIGTQVECGQTIIVWEATLWAYGRAWRGRLRMTPGGRPELADLMAMQAHAPSLLEPLPR